MIEPKPLSRAERGRILGALTATAEQLTGRGHWPDCYAQDIRALLAAEQYWREAVKNADVFRGGEPCVFCNGVQGDEPEHGACAWTRAQE